VQSSHVLDSGTVDCDRARNLRWDGTKLSSTHTAHVPPSQRPSSFERRTPHQMMGVEVCVENTVHNSTAASAFRTMTARFLSIGFPCPPPSIWLTNQRGLSHVVIRAVLYETSMTAAYVSVSEATSKTRPS
jgi:hypothetical protein